MVFEIWTPLLGVPVIFYLIYLYIQHNDRALSSLPPEAIKFSPHRLTAQDVLDKAARLRDDPITIKDALPPKMGRRYIVVGGAGFLGGWIVVHLLARGEDPKRIRVIDIRAPTRSDLTTGKARDVDFRIADVSHAASLNAAFAAPWPVMTDLDAGSESEPETTIFHTAANIRFYERTLAAVPLSAQVNIEGTRNVIAAARAIGASVLVFTSSGSISVRRTRFWLWPWEDAPPRNVQVIDDDDTKIPKEHGHFFSNYAYTKRTAEGLVRDADKSPSGSKALRTGCIRPGNGVYGPGGDILCGAYLVRKTNPTWIPNILQSFVYVENCSLAHLLYEQRLIEHSNTSNSAASPTTPDLGGQAFCVCDPGPPVTFGDVYTALSTLSKGAATFPILPPTPMLAVAHLFELWHITRHYLLSLSLPALLTTILSKLLPPLGGDTVNLQPALFALTSIHVIFDDSRARLPPAAGGLGYGGGWTTLEGLCKLYEEHVKQDGVAEERQKEGGGVSFGFGLVRAERGVAKAAERLMEVEEASEKMLN